MGQILVRYIRTQKLIDPFLTEEEKINVVFAYNETSATLCQAITLTSMRAAPLASVIPNHGVAYAQRIVTVQEQRLELYGLPDNERLLDSAPNGIEEKATVTIAARDEEKVEDEELPWE
jgi:hypothetical protein